jgi:hypothetical protein
MKKEEHVSIRLKLEGSDKGHAAAWDLMVVIRYEL